ncbi:hypothetical protein QJS10_CPA09g00944 [Acorus calamus]|uniref:Uncharacterized protein n=1 Tax=Acorus calamus TaxID=4465 RepID=A0AAV9E5I5_ACOCL|nr:hypothetical protein QJS10_CPA09g00944 [Acorus calamus]
MTIDQGWCIVLTFYVYDLNNQQSSEIAGSYVLFLKGDKNGQPMVLPLPLLGSRCDALRVRAPRHLDPRRPPPHTTGERLRLAVVLWNKAAAREIINVSEELHKASNNEIIMMVTWMREGNGVDEAGELVKGVVETIQTFNLSDFVKVLRGVDVQGIKGRMMMCIGRFDEVLERIMRREE